MKSYQKGFSVVEILIIIVVAGLLGGIGWYVFQNRDNADSKINSTKQEIPADVTQNAKASDATPKIDTTVHEVDVKMQTAADISKLPDYTPASFKAYMLEILQNNKFYHNSADGVDTIAQYQISKISQVNIAGGQVPVDENGEGHAGGAPAIWVLSPMGTWDQESLNGPVCKSKNGGLIYEEFISECYTDPTTDSWTKNPNGSIETLAR